MLSCMICWIAYTICCHVFGMWLLYIMYDLLYCIFLLYYFVHSVLTNICCIVLLTNICCIVFSYFLICCSLFHVLFVVLYILYAVVYDLLDCIYYMLSCIWHDNVMYFHDMLSCLWQIILYHNNIYYVIILL